MGFGLACAPVRCAHQSFWGICHAKRGAARPPLIAASLLHIRTPKIKIIYRTRVARVKGIFQLYHRGQRVYRVPGLLYSRPNWVPHPLTCKRVLLPHLDPRGGGRHIHFKRRGWGELIPTMGHTLWYSTPPFIQGGDTLTFRGGGGGNRFRRWGIHSGILQLVYFNLSYIKYAQNKSACSLS